MVESSLVLTWMSSPGNSICRFCCSAVTGCSTTRSYCVRPLAPHTIRLIVPAALPSIRISRGWTTVASAIAGFVIAIRVMLKSVASTVERPAVSDTFGNSLGRAAGGCALAAAPRRPAPVQPALAAPWTGDLCVGGDAGGREQNGTRQRRELTVDGLYSGFIT